jgi:hypothetical protein
MRSARQKCPSLDLNFPVLAKASGSRLRFTSASLIRGDLPRFSKDPVALSQEQIGPMAQRQIANSPLPDSAVDGGGIGYDKFIAPVESGWSHWVQ